MKKFLIIALLGLVLLGPALYDEFFSSKKDGKVAYKSPAPQSKDLVEPAAPAEEFVENYEMEEPTEGFGFFMTDLMTSGPETPEPVMPNTDNLSPLEWVWLKINPEWVTPNRRSDQTSPLEMAWWGMLSSFEPQTAEELQPEPVVASSESIVEEQQPEPVAASSEEAELPLPTKEKVVLQLRVTQSAQ